MSYPSDPNQPGGYPPQGGYPPPGGYPPQQDYPPPYGQPPGYNQPSGYGQQPPGQRSGLVRQVPTLGILMMVHGGLVAALGLFLAVVGAISGTVGTASLQYGASSLDPAIAGVLYLVWGVVIALIGGLNIFAGMKIKNYRSKTLGMIALGAAVLTALTCWCAPTAIGLLIFGLIVLLNEDVKRAFEMGEQGYSPQDIQRSYYGY